MKLALAFAENGKRQVNAQQSLIVLGLLATPRQTSLLLGRGLLRKIGIGLLVDHAVARLRIAQARKETRQSLLLHRVGEASLLQEKPIAHHVLGTLKVNALTPNASTGILQLAGSLRKTASAAKARNATSCMLAPGQPQQKAGPIQLFRRTRTRTRTNL